MSAKVHIVSKTEPTVVGMLNTIARTVVRIVSSSQSKPTLKQSNDPSCELVWSVAVCVELPGSLPLHGKPLHAGSEHMLRACLKFQKRFCLRHQMMFSNWMRIWSFVQKKEQTRWVWTAMCRRTRQIVAFVIGDRSKATCLRLWQTIPEEYKHCRTFSDFWSAYRSVFPAETHRCVGKETGETAHMERWNNTLRQRLGRYARQTLSFSKSDTSHHATTQAFIVQYNSSLSLTI